MHLIDQEEHALGCPVIEASKMIPSFLGFGFDIRYLEVIGDGLAQYLPTPLSREAAHVGNDMAASLDGGYHIGMDGP